MLTEIIIFFIAILLLYKFFYSKPDGFPPGEWGLPILGYLPAKEEPITKFLNKVHKKHGDIFSLKMGTRLAVFLTDYATIKSAFSKPEFSGRPDFFSLRVFRKFQNTGVIAADGEVWHTTRKFAMKALKDLGFGKSSLSKIISYEVKIMIDEIMKQEGKPAKIDMCLNIAVVNAIMGVTTGKRYDLNDEESLKIVKWITDSFADSAGLLAIFNFYPWLLKITPQYILDKYCKYSELMEITDYFLGYIKRIVIDHLEDLDKENPRDLIDMYIIEHEEKKHLPGSIYVDDDHFNLVALLADLYAAGSETTSSTIRWYCYYMAKYPEIQKKIQLEIDSVVPTDRYPEYEDMESLPYFEASIHEIQRIVSLAPIGVPHAATEDVTLNGYNIPKGTIIFPCVEMCHRSLKYWKNPTKFDPNNFIDENGKFMTPKEGYLPFIVGRRVCLGESIAKMELIMYLSAIVQTFTITEPEDNPITLMSMAKAHHNLNLPISQDIVFTKRTKTED